jgi:hypothetical protein
MAMHTMKSSPKNSKHIRLQQQYVFYNQQQEVVDVWKVATLLQWADQLTKTLKPVDFIRQKKVLLGHSGIPEEE